MAWKSTGHKQGRSHPRQVDVEPLIVLDGCTEEDPTLWRQAQTVLLALANELAPTSLMFIFQH